MHCLLRSFGLDQIGPPFGALSGLFFGTLIGVVLGFSFGVFHILKDRRHATHGGAKSDTRSPNKTVQATPMNAAVLPLRSWAGLCHRYGVPDLFRYARSDLL